MNDTNGPLVGRGIKKCHISKYESVEVGEEAFRLDSRCLSLVCSRWQQKDPEVVPAPHEDGCVCEGL